MRFPRDHITWKEIETQETFTITRQITTEFHQFIVGVSLIYITLLCENLTRKNLFPHNVTNKNSNKSTTKKDSNQSMLREFMKTIIYPYFSYSVTYVHTHEHWTRMRFLKRHSSSRLNITCLHKSPSHPFSSISPGLPWFIANVLIVPVQSLMTRILQNKDAM